MVSASLGRSDVKLIMGEVRYLYAPELHEGEDESLASCLAMPFCLSKSGLLLPDDEHGVCQSLEAAVVLVEEFVRDLRRIWGRVELLNLLDLLPWRIHGGQVKGRRMVPGKLSWSRGLLEVIMIFVGISE